MKLWAISDLHLANRINRQALDALRAFPEDWLILAGDVGESEAHLRYALAVLTRRFAKVIWVPGNHDLWTRRVPFDDVAALSTGGPGSPGAHPTAARSLRGVAKYRHLIEICRGYGVATPEDPYPEWSGELPAGVDRCLLAPLFTLYDYSFRPQEIAQEEAVAWASASGVVASDEILLHPDPYPTRAAWCAERCRLTAARLEEAAGSASLVLINHYPLRQDLAILPRIPRFSIWCGTRLTEDWHLRYRALKVVFGHLHIRGTRLRDGIPFEEVSLGYPRQWDPARGLEAYLREILPGSGRCGGSISKRKRR